MDDVAGVEVSYNHISGYGTALCVQTPGAEVQRNDVSDNCTGVYVDPGVDGARIHDNRITGQTAPAPGGFAAGIAVFDFPPPPGAVTVASGNVVARNFLRNNDVD